MYMQQLDLPGFGQVQVSKLIQASGAKPAAVAVAVAEALQGLPVLHPVVWARSRLDLLPPDMTPLDRAEANVSALKVAARMVGSQFPSSQDRETLERFGGWGSLSGLFQHNLSTRWQQLHDDVKNIVGADRIEDVRAGTTTSFFTPPALARAVWEGVAKMGFQGGNILDPSAGHGMFLSQMPEDIAMRSRVTAIEPEPASARILKALYAPYGVNVMETTFEAAALPEGSFDLAITNVPFGDFGVKERRSVPFQRFLIHDYFLARAMEVVRPGGIVAVVTSTGTLEKDRDVIRQYLATKARLVTALRLPDEAFAGFAGTETSVDVLIFQRLEGRRVQRNGDAWVNIGSLPAKSPHMEKSLADRCFYAGRDGMPVNRWFANSQDRLLGLWAVKSGQYGAERRVLVTDGKDWLPRVKSEMASLPSDAYLPAVTKPKPTAVSIDTSIQPGSFLVGVDGKLCVADEIGVAHVLDSKGKTYVDRVMAMVALRDHVKALLVEQSVSTDEIGLLRDRNALNEAYDVFVAKFGVLNSTANARAFAGDPAAYLLQALETRGPDGAFVKSDILTRRTVKAEQELACCDTPKDALKASLAHHGKVDSAWIAKLTSMTETQAMDSLASEGLVYRNHVDMAWITADEYLSGDVRRKFREADAMGDAWKLNAEALRQVVPEDLPPGQISAGLGSTWIPADVYEDFIGEVFNTNSARVSYDALTGSWSLGSTWCGQAPVAILNAYGVSGRLSPLDLMDLAMNQREPTVTDPDPAGDGRIVNQVLTIEAREKQEALKAKFAEWAWSDGDRAQRLARLYNEAFRSIVPRVYDGSHLDLPGYSHHLTLQPHQKNGVWRIVTAKCNTLLAHKVGYGKTLQMVCSGMELRRLGTASKIAYVVPNATLGDFVIEFVKAYPMAKLLVATEADFSGDNRRRFLARAATGDWDGVVLSHSSFERILLSKEAVEGFIRDQIADLQAAASSHDGTVKQKERMKRKWEARLAQNANRKGDEECLPFDQIGFDWLMVDEAHYFKNLFRFSKMSRIAGLPDSDSQRAFDMYMKCKLVTEAHGGKCGVVFATGTPVANSMAELHVMQRFLQSTTLARSSIQAFDSWAANFGEVVTALEIAPDGSGYRMNRRFSRFVNIPELMAIFLEVADIQVADLPYLKVPVFARETVAAKASDELRAYVESLVERAEKIRTGSVSPKDDNMLSVTNDGRNAALDMRLVDPVTYKNDPDGKVTLCVANVLRIWRETAAEKLTQAIFCDLGTPNSDGRFSVYEDVKVKLLCGGVPEAEIAFAHDAATHAARAKLASDVRDGRIRIVLGSTQKLGVGVNIQTRLIAVHHLDAPWRPADIEQREGRIIRQGNRNERVWIYRYVTDGSFDAYMWQTLETKAKFIAQVMSGDTAIRTAEDLELAALSYAEVKALASGNPLVIEKAGVDAEVAKLAILKSAHSLATDRAKHGLAMAPSRLDAATRRLGALKADVASRAGIQQPAFVVRGQNVPLNLAGKVIHAVAAANLYPGAQPVTVGTVGPFHVEIARNVFGEHFTLSVVGQARLSESYSGKEISAQHAFERLLGPEYLRAEARKAAEQVEFLRRQADEFRFEATRPFEKEARYQELLVRQAEIQDALGLSDQVKGALDTAA